MWYILRIYTYDLKPCHLKFAVYIYAEYTTSELSLLIQQKFIIQRSSSPCSMYYTDVAHACMTHGDNYSDSNTRIHTCRIMIAWIPSQMASATCCPEQLWAIVHNSFGQSFRNFSSPLQCVFVTKNFSIGRPREKDVELLTAFPSPSWLHTTVALSRFHPSSQRMPHVLL